MTPTPTPSSSPTLVIRIDPDGTVTECAGPALLGLARAELGEVDVFSIRAHQFAPFPGGADLVACVEQWGATTRNATGGPLPINVKVWALYGRSPVFGPAFLAHDRVSEDLDDREPLDPEWIATMRTDWVPADVLERMRAVAEADGLTWPG